MDDTRPMYHTSVRVWVSRLDGVGVLRKCRRWVFEIAIPSRKEFRDRGAIFVQGLRILQKVLYPARQREVKARHVSRQIGAKQVH